MTGQLVAPKISLSGSGNTFMIDVANLPADVYMVSLENSGEKVRFVVK